MAMTDFESPTPLSESGAILNKKRYGFGRRGRPFDQRLGFGAYVIRKGQI